MYLSRVLQFTENDLKTDHFSVLSANQISFSSSVAKVREGAISHKKALHTKKRTSKEITVLNDLKTTRKYNRYMDQRRSKRIGKGPQDPKMNKRIQQDIDGTKPKQRL